MLLLYNAIEMANKCPHGDGVDSATEAVHQIAIYLLHT